MKQMRLALGHQDHTWRFNAWFLPAVKFIDLARGQLAEVVKEITLAYRAY